MKYVLTCLIVAGMADCLGATPIRENKTIVWEHSTLVQITQRATYARMIRLDNGSLLCAYESRGKSYVRKSTDNGKSWDKAVLAAACSWGFAANPELLQLENGWILLPYNERPTDRTHPYTIRVAVSKDRGLTWHENSLVYMADTLRTNGCWEPAAVQLANGEILLFFANESPYRTSNEQEISLVTSRDNGRTWSASRTASFRSGFRDGMPVPCVLKSGKGIVLAIEDRGLPGRNTFQPAIVCSSIEAPWPAPVDGRSDRRWEALKNPLKPDVYAGAPYLRQMPSGTTVLSVQVQDPGQAGPTMVVYLGNEDARRFSSPSKPFENGPGSKQKWGSLFVKDANTITALSSCLGGVWSIDGRIVRSSAVAGKRMEE
ncbi:MAG: sialidase family protein [Kiritimatiellia bacterium]|nr:sialidase family protein [Kiritimatiellia bacterium]MDP6848593.1 sialidase family protein [Kiritimatiellia bacterium]